MEGEENECKLKKQILYFIINWSKLAAGGGCCSVKVPIIFSYVRYIALTSKMIAKDHKKEKNIRFLDVFLKVLKIALKMQKFE